MIKLSNSFGGQQSTGATQMKRKGESEREKNEHIGSRITKPNTQNKIMTNKAIKTVTTSFTEVKNNSEKNIHDIVNHFQMQRQQKTQHNMTRQIKLMIQLARSVFFFFSRFEISCWCRRFCFCSISLSEHVQWIFHMYELGFCLFFMVIFVFYIRIMKWCRNVKTIRGKSI